DHPTAAYRWPARSRLRRGVPYGGEDSRPDCRVPPEGPLQAPVPVPEFLTDPLVSYSDGLPDGPYSRPPLPRRRAPANPRGLQRTPAAAGGGGAASGTNPGGRGKHR